MLVMMLNNIGDDMAATSAGVATAIIWKIIDEILHRYSK